MFANNVISNAQYVTETVYSSDDKFEYAQAVCNLELQSGTKYAKISTPDP